MTCVISHKSTGCAAMLAAQVKDYAHACCWAGCRLKEVDHGELELDLNWYSVLDQQPAQ